MCCTFHMLHRSDSIRKLPWRSRCRLVPKHAGNLKSVLLLQLYALGTALESTTHSPALPCQRGFSVPSSLRHHFTSTFHPIITLLLHTNMICHEIGRIALMSVACQRLRAMHLAPPVRPAKAIQPMPWCRWRKSKFLIPHRDRNRDRHFHAPDDIIELSLNATPSYHATRRSK